MVKYLSFPQYKSAKTHSKGDINVRRFCFAMFVSSCWPGMLERAYTHEHTCLKSCSFISFTSKFLKIKTNYDLLRACLLNRSAVPAMDLKSNRSGLRRHMLETCRRLRRLCRKHVNNVARHDRTPVKSTLLSRDMSFMSRRSNIML